MPTRLARLVAVLALFACRATASAATIAEYDIQSATSANLPLAGNARNAGEGRLDVRPITRRNVNFEDRPGSGDFYGSFWPSSPDLGRHFQFEIRPLAGKRWTPVSLRYALMTSLFSNQLGPHEFQLHASTNGFAGGCCSTMLASHSHFAGELPANTQVVFDVPLTEEKLAALGLTAAPSGATITFRLIAAGFNSVAFGGFSNTGAFGGQGANLTIDGVAVDAPVGCGDGVLQGGETCDDGFQVDGDGCTTACSIEPGWRCAGVPSACCADSDDDGVCDEGLVVEYDLGSHASSATPLDPTIPPSNVGRITSPPLTVRGVNPYNVGGNGDFYAISWSSFSYERGYVFGVTPAPGVEWRPTKIRYGLMTALISQRLGPREFYLFASTDGFAGGCCTVHIGLQSVYTGEVLVDYETTHEVVITDEHWAALGFDTHTVSSPIEFRLLATSTEPNSFGGLSNSEIYGGAGANLTVEGIVRTSCGDGQLDPAETCDDGGTAGGDGCSALCILEPGWYCTGVPSFCCVDVEGDQLCDEQQCVHALSECEADLTATAAAAETCEAALTTAVADADDDGRRDLDDACAGTDASAVVDSDGCSQAEFCGRIDTVSRGGARRCQRADWRNDEPAMRSSERDCRLDRTTGGCVVAYPDQPE